MMRARYNVEFQNLPDDPEKINPFSGCIVGMIEESGPGLESLGLYMAVMVKVDQKHRTQHNTSLDPDTAYGFIHLA